MPTRTTPAPSTIHQLKVTLRDSAPPIWRRVQVPSDITLSKLHKIVQVVMGWTDSHLHQFIVGTTYYGIPDPAWDADVQNERRAKLAQIAPHAKAKFTYEYDFGDGWLHELVVENILSPEEGTRYPVCINGKRACPPEDCGGVWGYESFLEAIGDPNHPEHDEMLAWVGGSFDPETFEIEAINRQLVRMR